MDYIDKWTDGLGVGVRYGSIITNISMHIFKK